MTKTSHTNKEDVVKCPIEGCTHDGLSRGIHLHVMQSSGNGHGPHGDIPEHLDFGSLETVGEKNVEMKYPDEQETSETVRLCPFCGRAFQGYRGLKIHLGQKVGHGVHPVDAKDVAKTDAPIAHVDDDMNVIEIVEEATLMPSTKRRLMNENSIPREKVIDFIEALTDGGHEQAAEMARNQLL